MSGCPKETHFRFPKQPGNAGANPICADEERDTRQEEEQCLRFARVRGWNRAALLHDAEDQRGYRNGSEGEQTTDSRTLAASSSEDNLSAAAGADTCAFGHLRLAMRADQRFHFADDNIRPHERRIESAAADDAQFSSLTRMLEMMPLSPVSSC